MKNRSVQRSWRILRVQIDLDKRTSSFTSSSVVAVRHDKKIRYSKLLYSLRPEYNDDFACNLFLLVTGGKRVLLLSNIVLHLSESKKQKRTRQTLSKIKLKGLSYEIDFQNVDEF